MFSRRKRNQKGIAAFFLLLLTVQDFFPVAAYALTSGPAQPEMQKFQQAGVSNMVDLFSGDFKYDIPLMDVGGYPVNLSYHSGGGFEDEASWVGVGWSLNPGSVNRSMRGIPDDFNGKATDGMPDMIRTTQHKKDFYKIGGQIVVKPSVFGMEVGKASMHLGIYKDNYYGIGGELGASLNFDVAENSAGALTAGLGLNSDSRSGVTLSPSLSLTSSYEDCKELNNGSLTGGFSYNTRSGLQETNLGLSFGANASQYNEYGRETSAGGLSMGFASFNKEFGHSYTPTFGSSSTNTKKTFSFDLGAIFFGGYFGFGGSGYIYTEKNKEVNSTLPAFGYMNYDAGSKNTNAILDFNREKDGPYIENAPAIPIPVATEDYFTATSQAGVMQFRPYYNGEYTVFDRTYTNASSSVGLGLTAGVGNALQTGGRVDWEGNGAGALTRRWDNNYTTAADGAMPVMQLNGTQLPEASYFKKTGELTMADPSYYGLLFNDKTQKVSLNAGFSSNSQTFAGVIYNGGSPSVSNMRRNCRDIRTSPFSYLTAKEAKIYGLDKKINGQYDRVDDVAADPISTVHKPHHISEITITDEEGKRMVYGVPVYNIDQQEVSFNVTPQDVSTSFSGPRKNGLISYDNGTDNSINNGKGRANIYDKKTIPPYATSFLLSGILSPDYVDKTGDGITDDDLGTAVKFRYQRWSSNYNWRAPFESGMASFNEGFLSDGKDDKGSYVFGKKELWYLDTIVSKTMVAIFYKSKRVDGYGVAGDNGGIGSSDDQRPLKLDSIRLFTRAEMVSHPDQPIPIKVVHFEYDYSLYPGLPNSTNTPAEATGRNPLLPYDPYSPVDPYDKKGVTNVINLNPHLGKLTLRKVYFTFGANVRGRTNPYLFSYNMTLVSDAALAGKAGAPAATDPEATDSYTPRQTDRWGTYKQSYYNRILPNGPGGALKSNMNNSEFPYTLQPSKNELFDTRLVEDRFAAKWQLSDIIVPTGGEIVVDYESDDYSYVQDRKAMQECQLTGIGGAGQVSGISKANKLYMKMPVPVTNRADFIRSYLSGPDGQNWTSIGFKVFTDLDNHGHYEYVYGYVEVDYSQDHLSDWTFNQDIASIPVKMVNSYNPISKAAWQILQADLPQYAYGNYDNSDATSFGDNVLAAVKSIVQAFANLRELGESFDQTAFGKNFGSRFKPEMSSVRLNSPIGLPPNGGPGAVKPSYGKLGGGSRVRHIEISDTWDNMGGTTAKPLINGILYEYTTLDDKGAIISSGVAAYEPGIGNEENPFHEPAPYTEKVQWSQDRYHYIEKPYGESYFPGPEVGYSEVKATSYGADKFYNKSPNVYYNTGYTLSRFFTAKDFPTQVDFMPLDVRTAENDLTLLLFGSRSTKRVVTSQGFKVVLNDMHGKPRFTGVYDKGGALLSSSEYFYNVKDDKAPQQQLNNNVLTLSPVNGRIAAGGNLIGTDEELVTDIRESTNKSSGHSIGAYVGFFYAFFPVPFASVNYTETASERYYNSVSTIKVIHQYGVLKSTKTTQNGSTLMAENLLWDGLTGQVLLSRTQNEFDDYTYALSYPAHMAYDGMSAAYKNIGTLFAGLLPYGSGSINTGYSSYLSPGDELVNTDLTAGTGVHGWVIPDPTSAGNYHLVDQGGNFITTNGNYRLVRSGRRNLLQASVGTVVTMTNPLVQSSTGDYSLQAAVDKRVLASKAVTYKDEWDMPVPKFQTTAPQTETDGFLISVGQIKGGGSWLSAPMTALCNGLFSFNPVNQRRYMYSYNGDNVTLQTILQSALDAGTISPNNFFLTCGPGTIQPPPLSQLQYYLEIQRSGNIIQPGDRAFITYNGMQIGIITFTHFPIFNLFPGDVPIYCSTNSSGCSSSGAFVEQNYVSNGQTCPDPGVATPITVNYTAVPQTYALPPLVACNDPLNQVLNPYYQDVKGVWRVDYDHVYQVNRTQVPGNPAQTGGTNIRYSGYYSNYTPFWAFNAKILTPLAEVANSPIQHTLTDPRWEWTSKSVHFDQKSNEIESVDPLKRYSAALYGYQQTVATAVATNARQNEIAFDGFEDYNFNLINPVWAPANPCPLGRHLEMGLSGSPATNGSSTIVSTTAHSGNYSLQLQSLNITQPAGSGTPAPNVLGFDAIGRYILLSNEQAAGFAPISGKQYLLSFWVKDGSDETNTITGLQVTINSESKDISSKHWPVVEKWKKVEIPFTAASNGFTLSLNAGSSMYLDDLRIQPFDSQIKTFVYDDRTMRLTGQLDENNFGVFYEYDEEGTPIRIKKETERGIMTVKENRQSYKKYTQPQTQN